METVKELSGFYKAIMDDCRISATHISLYMALFQRWNLNHFEGPVIFFSREIMPMAKIDSRATYHKCLHDLVEYGYIRYIPSYNPLVPNQALINCDSNGYTKSLIENYIN